MTKQEIFNKVWQHFIVEKNPPGIAINEYGPICVYRGNNGAKCAAGILIPDEIYSAEFEGKNIKQLFDEFPFVTIWLGLDVDLMRFIRVLQSFHDTSAVGVSPDHKIYLRDDFREVFVVKLRNIAEMHNLEVPN